MHHATGSTSSLPPARTRTSRAASSDARSTSIRASSSAPQSERRGQRAAGRGPARRRAARHVLDRPLPRRLSARRDLRARLGPAALPGVAALVAGRPLALFAAAGSATVPGMVYGAMLIPEPLAYFWSALTVFLVAKALATRSRWWIGFACAGLLVAPLVRSQLTVLIAAAAVA